MESQLIKTDRNYRWLFMLGLSMAVFAAMMGWFFIFLLQLLGIIVLIRTGSILGEFFSGEKAAVIENEDNATHMTVNEGKSYDITVRIENGLSRIVHEENRTAWRSGIRVKVIDDATEMTPCDNAPKQTAYLGIVE